MKQIEILFILIHFVKKINSSLFPLPIEINVGNFIAIEFGVWKFSRGEGQNSTLPSPEVTLKSLD